ncbi:MAG: metallophosphoesterase [Pseudomonadota bacterium]|nr:metallophosphoesterase [Pseudomonadota bacterium]
MLRLAHLSDPHLGPLPTPGWRDLMGKRLTGFLSWRLKRAKIHDPRILELVVHDIRQHAPDHVALTGDLINIALAAEYQNARRWIGGFGSPDWISLVPGNHDAYVAMDWPGAFALWSEYFTGEARLSPDPGQTLASRFPYVRFRRNVAIIGASTAVPTWPGMATGVLGEPQLARLEVALRQARERGFYRVLLIHHPPLAGLAPPRKSLLDGADLVRVLEREGAELVLYGHNHRHQQTSLAGRHGTVHLIGVPSASQNLYNDATAAWNLFFIRREDKAWIADRTTRSFDPQANCMVTLSTQTLTHT